ncbi:MAG TPA: hypothetical protein VKV37_21400 [Ktedonobacteraceae bacterium]|nr:hypothetical protein [Ktedonobacteraceae bacterium]
MKTQQKTKKQTKTTGKFARPLLFGLLILGLAAAVFIPIYVSRSIATAGMGGGAAPESPAQLAASAPGAHVMIAVIVQAVSEQNIIQGVLLQPNRDGSYSRTQQTIRIQWDPNKAPVVMGSNQDVHQGAVIQVSGQVEAGGVFKANQVIILTGFMNIH